ncbi:MAG: FtsH protease activity modulator HflK [Verrucomicrobia bacterium]|nr:FtsH protease activity modulator HflK [Verrucomicrobiota bacterium]MDA1088349.1 FtsH protease activity modulator HflK [Verrucomicrobiota bacterium]
MSPRDFDIPLPTRIEVSPAMVFVVLLVLLIGSGLVTSIYTIPAESLGVVLRFGKAVDEVDPGLRFKLPYGIDTVSKVPVKRQLKQEFGFGTAGATNPAQRSHDPGKETLMVTGDLNAALVEWILQYRIARPTEYLFNVRNPGETLRDVSESVMREVVGDRTVDEVITIGRQEIESEALRKMQIVVNKYAMGLTIDQVQLKNVNPPQAVQASFDEVNKAQQEREKLINIANGEYNKAVPRARGQADRRIREAEGYQTRRVNEAQGDAKRFTALLTEYLKAPDVTRRRLYLETLNEVLPRLKSKIILDEAARGILPLLQLNSEAGKTP